MRPSLMPKRYFSTLFTRTLTLTLVYTKALEIEPPLIAYIAKSLAHVGNGERDKAYRACDIALERFHSSHVTFLLLLKVCMFVPGFLILFTSLRPLSCLWRESPSMRSHGWTTLSLLSTTTQFVMRFRCVHTYVLNSTTDVFNRHTCIFSSGTHAWRAATTRVQ